MVPRYVLKPTSILFVCLFISLVCVFSMSGDTHQRRRLQILLLPFEGLLLPFEGSIITK